MLDVKAGARALLKVIGPTHELACKMLGLGGDHGLPALALMTGMNTPLGLPQGNAARRLALAVAWPTASS
ncbi:hypothetical protein [Actinacidiphila glaucinigra]|uniref:hypothetical protein n=1 Tax=Actinacidiphila glaucinigra TaxID=235986 RepID=UPI0038132C87